MRTRTAAIAMFAGLLVAGCRYGFGTESGDAGDASAPVVPPPPSYTSGTRLRAEIHEIGNAKRFVSWFDTQLGEECSLEVAEDGVTRCLPTRLGVGVQFTDPTCMTNLIVSLPPVDKTDCPFAGALAVWQQLDGRWRVVHVGAPYSGTFYQGAPGNCVMLGGTQVDPYYLVGATVPPDTFVAFHDELSPSGDLAYIEHVGEDGSRVLALDELAIAASGEHCTLLYPSIDGVMCVAKETSGSLVYADAACTERAVVTTLSASQHVRSSTSSTCHDDYLEVSISDEIGSFYQPDSQGVCMTGNLPAGWHIYRTTSVVPIVPIASGTRAVPAPSSGSTVVLSSWQFTQGQSLPAGFYDTAHGDGCEVTSVANTHERVCAPIWSGYQPVYTDASCSTAAGGPPKCDGAWRSTWYPTSPFQWTCEGPASHVQLYNQPIAGPFFARDGQSCSAADPTVVQPLGMSFTDLPASQMALVARRMD